MASHRPQYIEHRDSTKIKPKWYWRCSTCGKTNADTPGSRQEAEDAAYVHAEDIKRVRANLYRGRGSLTVERDHAKRMLLDANTPAKDLPYWQMLYDGAVHRLGERGATADEDAMF